MQIHREPTTADPAAQRGHRERRQKDFQVRAHAPAVLQNAFSPDGTHSRLWLANCRHPSGYVHRPEWSGVSAIHTCQLTHTNESALRSQTPQQPCARAGPDRGIWCWSSTALCRMCATIDSLLPLLHVTMHPQLLATHGVRSASCVLLRFFCHRSSACASFTQAWNDTGLLQVHALQFEWAWQNPQKSKWTRGLPEALKKQRMRVDKQARPRSTLSPTLQHVDIARTRRLLVRTRMAPCVANARADPSSAAQRSVRTCAGPSARSRPTSGSLQVALVTEMLNVDPWCKYPLALQVLHGEFEPLLNGTRPAEPVRRARITATVQSVWLWVTLAGRRRSNGRVSSR